MTPTTTTMGAAEWLLLLSVALPLFGAIVVWLLPRTATDPAAGAARLASVGVLALTFACTVALWFVAPTDSSATIDWPWIADFGARFRLAATGLSLPMVVMSTALMLCSVLLTNRQHTTHRAASFYALTLMLIAGINGIFLAADLLLFYLCWEVMLIPLYFLIGVWGSGTGAKAGKTFFIYTMMGSLLMLVAIVAVGLAAGGTTYEQLFTMAAVQPMGMTAQLLCFGAFAAAFLVKSALVPFHTWLPDAQGEGPPLAAAALGIKVGTYGMIALAVPLFPSAAFHPAVRTALAGLGVLAVLYGSLVALVQPDFRRVMSYASIAHLGFVVLGISAFTVESLQGSLFVMVNAGITTGGMFLLLGLLRNRLPDDRFGSLGGLAKSMPMFGALLVLFTLANVGLPGTNGFVGEFLVLLGSFARFPVLVLLATVGVILAAAYLLWAVQRTLFGPEQQRDASTTTSLRDLSGAEAFVMGAFVLAIVGLGLAPAPVLRRMESSISTVVAQSARGLRAAPVAAVDMERGP
jgi:NADH-quinone oxidoreductase subunit M